MDLQTFLDRKHEHIAFVLACCVVVGCDSGRLVKPETSRGAPRPTGQAAGETAPNEAPLSESAEGEEDATPAAPSENLATAYGKEARDSAWSAPHEQAIQESVQALTGTVFVSVDCRTSVCMLVVSHKSFRDSLRWKMQFDRQLASRVPPPARWTHHEKPSQGGKQSTLYITRPGYAEPNADGSPRQWPASP